MKKGSDSDNLGDALIKSVTQSGAGEIARDVSEMALDSVLEEGLLKDVPVFGWLAKLYAASMTVRDILFLKKVAYFLFGTRSADQDANDKFRKAMDANQGFRRKVGENLVLLLERHDHFDKSLLLGKVFSEYLRGRIDYEQFLRIASSIDRVPITDLNQLSLYKDHLDSYDGKSGKSFANALNADTCQSLYTSGLVASSSTFEVNYHPNEVNEVPGGADRQRRMNTHRDRDVGAADKAAIQLVKVQPGQLLVSDTLMPHLRAGNQSSYAWCKRPGSPEDSVLYRWAQPRGLSSLGA